MAGCTEQGKRCSVWRRFVACHQSLPHTNLLITHIQYFLVAKQQTCYVQWPQGYTLEKGVGEKEKGLEEVLYCSREVWSSAGKLVRHNSRTPVHSVVKFNKLWGSFHQSFPVPLCHERGNTAESEERSTILNTPPASSIHCTCSQLSAHPVAQLGNFQTIRLHNEVASRRLCYWMSSLHNQHLVAQPGKLSICMEHTRHDDQIPTPQMIVSMSWGQPVSQPHTVIT